MDTNNIAANHFCANVYADLYLCCPHIIEISFLRGRLAVRRTVLALQKRSTVTYLVQNLIVVQNLIIVQKNLSENVCCVVG